MSEPIPAVLVPGLDGTGELFAPFAAALGPGFASAPVRFADALVGWEEHCTAVERALLEAGQPALLVAESFGGPVAVMAAARQPERVRGLLLVATFLVRPSWNLGLIRPWFRLVVGTPWPGALRQAVLVALLASPALDPGLRRRLVAVNDRQRAPVLARRLGLCAGVDVRTEFSALHLPIAYVAGSADRILPTARHAAMVRALQPRAHVELLPGAPHMMLQCRPGECAALARRLVASA
ncbi:MAG: alpha/beta fold hydrolase [Deltaproteobacteria bacterium]|nr:alpha/beta fold hydrolase [Deltaproteobacteria bacterium]